MRNITLLSIASASAVAMATMMAATTLIVLPRNAAATPVFAQQTGLPCGQCHENPAGGGKLKEFGQKFQANGNKLPGK
jgi:cytochrome c553